MKKSVTDTPLEKGDKCPVCKGKGLIFQERDLHRSAGWIPCGFSTDVPHPTWGRVIDLRCAKGTLIR